MGVVSNGPVASVALFTRREIADIRSIALDQSSRTSVALLRVLCADHFRLTPEWRTAPPDLDAMLAVADAALIIGDPALFIDPVAAGVRKIDLGETWTAWTGLPFVYAGWVGRPGRLTPEQAGALEQARDRGVAESDAVARAFFAGAPDADRLSTMGAHYLRHNIQFTLGDAERSGLQTFFDRAAALGLVPAGGRVRFY
jgi:predicted solute-binding protein